MCNDHQDLDWILEGLSLAGDMCYYGDGYKCVMIAKI